MVSEAFSKIQGFYSAHRCARGISMVIDVVLIHRTFEPKIVVPFRLSLPTHSEPNRLRFLMSHGLAATIRGAVGTSLMGQEGLASLLVML